MVTDCQQATSGVAWNVTKRGSTKMLNKVVDAACRECGITRHDFHSSPRNRRVIDASEIVALVARNYMIFSYPEIRKLIDGMDTGHTTWIGRYRRASRRHRSTDPDDRDFQYQYRQVLLSLDENAVIGEVVS